MWYWAKRKTNHRWRIDCTTDLQIVNMYQSTSAMISMVQSIVYIYTYNSTPVTLWVCFIWGGRHDASIKRKSALIQSAGKYTTIRMARHCCALLELARENTDSTVTVYWDLLVQVLLMLQISNTRMGLSMGHKTWRPSIIHTKYWIWTTARFQALRKRKSRGVESLEEEWQSVQLLSEFWMCKFVPRKHTPTNTLVSIHMYT